MLCQLCKKNPATIKISYMIADKKSEMNICKECAEHKGIDNPINTLPQIFDNFIVELLGEHASGEDTWECESCGTTWEEFQKTGLFGCEICYQTFKDELDILLRRIHGSNKHIGSRPHSQRTHLDPAEIKRIERELQAAIASENFELAAELRDLIRDAQRELERKDDDGILR